MKSELGLSQIFSGSLIFLEFFFNQWSGLAGTHESWGPQIRGLTGTETPNEDDEPRSGDCLDNEASFSGDGIEVCAFDNRGMGRSSVPAKKSEYT